MKKRIIGISVIVGIIIIIVTIFISYAYVSSKITNNSASRKESFIAKNMEITYSGGTETLISDNTVFKPGSVIEKTFTVTNTGNVNYAYNIKLTDLVNTFKRTNDITYELYKDEELVKNAIFPNINNILIYTNISIEKNETHNYLLKIIYNNSTENQIEDSGSSLSAKITFVEKTNGERYFKDVLLENKAIVEDYDASGNSITLLENKMIDEMPSPITGVADDAEKSGIFTTEDDFGTSYVYRGTIRNNYVDFVGFTWRIVRINGDGSIRLILDGTLNKVCNDVDSTICKGDIYNPSGRENAYVGYMYGLTGMTEADNEEKCLMYDNANKTVINNISTYTTKETCEEAGGIWTTSAYEATHANLKPSVEMTNINNFYKKFISESYRGYLADTVFCGDKGLASESVGTDNTALGYGSNITYYAAYERIYNGDAYPTLKCENDFSTYIVNDIDINGKTRKGNLTYPIATLSADEFVMVGAYNKKINYKYYLYNATTLSLYWRTMTPSNVNSLTTNVFDDNVRYYTLHDTTVYDIGGSARPVINIRSDVLYDRGNGTSESPYTIMMGS